MGLYPTHPTLSSDQAGGAHRLAGVATRKHGALAVFQPGGHRHKQLRQLLQRFARGLQRIWSITLEKRRQFRQHIVHHRCRHAVYLAGLACCQIEHTRLISARDAGGLAAAQFHAKTQAARKVAAVGDWQNYR